MYFDLLITRIAYGLILFGIFIIFEDELLYYLKKLISTKDKLFKKKTKKAVVIHHLEKVLSIVYESQNVQRNARIFVAISMIIFVLFLYFLLQQGFNIKAIVIAVAMALMPYGYLRSKLATVRITGSYEGELVITEIVNHYKMNSRNIMATLDACIISFDNVPVSKRALFRLSMRVKSYQSEEELRDMLGDFIYAFNTEWSKMLADNFYSAIEEKIDVLSGFEDIQSECLKINENLEKGKRINAEAFAMIKYLGPIFFFIFLWMARSMMDYSWQTILQYEFQRKDGLLIFILAMGSIFINLVAINLLSRQKYDI